MAAAVSRTNVLVVGAGPVGLAAAIELGRRGVACTVVEQNDGVQSLPKMNFVNARSMEHCRRWGLARSVREAGWPPDHPMDVVYVTSLAGYELARFEQPSHAERSVPDYTPEGSQRCPQIWFDPILAEHAASLPTVDVRYGHRLDDLVQDADGVRATITELARGEQRRFECDWLVGADGAGSTVRRLLGIERDEIGPAPEQVAIALRTREFHAFHDKGPAAFFFVIDASGTRGVVTPTDGEQLWRFNWNLRPGESARDFDADAAVRHLAGADFSYEIVAIMPWTIRFTLAQRYCEGRAALVGDAARTLSPTGGLGMNTGIGDAVDLAWKLAAVLAGWGGPRLLESYDAERRPTGRRINEESLRNLVRLGGLPPRDRIAEASEDGARQRGALGRHIREGDFRLEFENEGACLGYRYVASPIVVRDGTLEPSYDPNRYEPSSWPGCRAPHAWLPDGRSTLDLFDTGFCLLRFGGDEARALPAAAADRGVPFGQVAIDDEKISRLYERRLVLVRPDGHVAWRADEEPVDPAAVIDAVRGA